MTERADDWKSYIALDGTHVIVAANAPTTVAELLEQRGLHRAQIVQNAEGTESHLVAELLDEAWQMADFVARYELVPRIAELQARIDAAVKLLDDYDGSTNLATLAKISAALTGGAR